MKILLIIFQFQHGSPKPWSQRRIQQLMTKHRAMYISRGVYKILTAETAEQVRDKIVNVAELNERDFVGVFPIDGRGSSIGHMQRGRYQPEWPPEEAPFPDKIED